MVLTLLSNNWGRNGGGVPVSVTSSHWRRFVGRVTALRLEHRRANPYHSALPPFADLSMVLASGRPCAGSMMRM